MNVYTVVIYVLKDRLEEVESQEWEYIDSIFSKKQNAIDHAKESVIKQVHVINNKPKEYIEGKLIFEEEDTEHGYVDNGYAYIDDNLVCTATVSKYEVDEMVRETEAE